MRGDVKVLVAFALVVLALPGPAWAAGLVPDHNDFDHEPAFYW
jgi:hypothetical protein